MNEDTTSFETFLSDYCNVVAKNFNERWDQYVPEIYRNEISETIGGLAARQTTLALEIARNPGIWNGHISPLILRCMTDAHITLAWILEDPEKRSIEYVRYGLGQEKLYLEYLENEIDHFSEYEENEPLEELIQVRRSWLNSQLLEWAIEVNVGSWSGISTRKMAQQAGCEALYKFAYVPFSGAVHNMWQHVGIYNVKPCQNPLHKYHRIPALHDLGIHPDFFYRSAKYVSRTFDLLDSKLGLDPVGPSPVKYFVDNQPFVESSSEDED